MQKYSGKLPKEDLKKFAKEVGKKLVASDFKNNRVEDPTKISEKQEKKVKKYVRDFFEKAVEKKKVMDKKKADRAERRSKEAANRIGANVDTVSLGKNEEAEEGDEKLEDDVDIQVSDDEEDDLRQALTSVPSTPNAITPADSDLKRKRDDDASLECDDSHKRLKDSQEPSPPPPPPPPPADGLGYTEGDELQLAEEQRELEEAAELKRQEEDLMRENEEAMMEDMESGLAERLAMNADAHAVNGSIDFGSVKAGTKTGMLVPRMKEINGNGVKSSEMEGVEATNLKHEPERKSVLSH